ncbi:MAG: ABC transporter ATP-binding protein, partial [Clostridiales bacterium]|nr:ABC transporter ATP-binding protein [Clostridiales bacterium]
IKSISKTYDKKTVLNAVDLTIGDQSAACIVGRNGSGKSTLLSILAGILKPDGGEILFDGVPVSEKRAAKNIGFVMQYDSLFEDLSVKDNLNFWAAAAGIRAKSSIENRFVALLGLSDFMHKKVKTLSGGMQRRAAICSALISDPKYIILDEPFAGLDLFYKSELIGYLKTLRDLGKTIVYTCHNSDEIIGLSDDLFVIDKAKIVFHKKSGALALGGADINGFLINLINGEDFLDGRKQQQQP